MLWALREAGHDVPGVDVFVDGTRAARRRAVQLGRAGVLRSRSAVADAARPASDTRACAATWSRACIRAETEVAGAPTGGMDQTVALLAEAGAALLIDFDDRRDAAGAAARSAAAGLGAAGHRHPGLATRSSTAGTPRAGRDCEAAAAALGRARRCGRPTSATVEALDDERVRRRARHVVTEIDRVDATVDGARGRRLGARSAGCFVASHVSMRDDFEISCPELDAVVDDRRRGRARWAPG